MTNPNEYIPVDADEGASVASTQTSRYAALRGLLCRIKAPSAHSLKKLCIVTGVVAAVFAMYRHPPMQNVARGEMGIRLNQLTGSVSEFSEGAIWVIPGIHSMRIFSLRDQVYRPKGADSVSGSAPFQSLEGLSIGVDVSVRYAFDPKRLVETAKNLPDDIDHTVIEPAVQGVLYKTLAQYTVREIFSIKREEIRGAISKELSALLAQDGITLHTVLIGKVDLPEHYKTGMEKLLAEELASEKMRYTLALKEKQVIQQSLEGQADKARREQDAAAAGEEQIIAAKAQAEAMKHILPFKQRQIEQRRLEAEADKVARIQGAEANAQARQIEAAGEAESRRKLADAEAYRQAKLGELSSQQMARDGALISKHPLLIQKAMVDKLSDKIAVIIAPPSTDGSFIGNTLLGKAAAPTENETASNSSEPIEQSH